MDEERRWREEAVTTKFTLDLAASVPLEVLDGAATCGSSWPEQGIEQMVEALVAGETYVVARVENDSCSSSRPPPPPPPRPPPRGPSQPAEAPPP